MITQKIQSSFTTFMRQECLWVVSLALMTLFISCDETLSETELNIINNDISESLYEEMVIERANALDDYLFECIDEYSDIVGDEVKNEIEQSARLSSFDFDISAIFGGPTKGERLAKQYNNYIDYINRNRQNMYDIIMGVAGKIAKNPRILNNFPGNSDTVDLYMFRDVEYIPNSISQTEYNKYANKTFNKSDKLDWGKTILPYSGKPNLSVPALVAAVISSLSELPYPKPVYAVYDNQYGAWEVGYNTKQAVNAVFTQNGDVINCEFQECTYTPAYVQSNNNILKRK